MCVLFTNHIWIHKWSLHVCSFHKPHMDRPVVIACVFFSTNHTWIHQWSLHVCSFHKLHMDQPESLHVCSFHKPHMDPLDSLHVCCFPQTTYGSTSTRVIACVLL